MTYILEHTTFGFCWWDLVALIILIALIVVFIVQMHSLNKKKKELEDQVSEKEANQVEIQ